jgi:L-rhamnono-1,4-lactonase
MVDALKPWNNATTAFQKIVDSHVHLWPKTAANPESHGWMEPGAHLTRQYSIEDYKMAISHGDSKGYRVSGFVYVETDRAIHDVEGIQSWAMEPLREIEFLRRIVEGKPAVGEGFAAEDRNLLIGAIAWAPIDRGFEAFRQYLRLAEAAAGEETWSKIKGFRFLLQGLKEPVSFRSIANDPQTIKVLQSFDSKWAFEVGVDQRQGGTWQLESVFELISSVLKGSSETTFILGKSIGLRF